MPGSLERYGRLRRGVTFKDLRYDRYFQGAAGTVVMLGRDLLGRDVARPIAAPNYTKLMWEIGLDNVLPLSPLELLALQAE